MKVARDGARWLKSHLPSAKKHSGCIRISWHTYVEQNNASKEEKQLLARSHTVTYKMSVQSSFYARDDASQQIQKRTKKLRAPLNGEKQHSKQKMW